MKDKHLGFLAMVIASLGLGIAVMLMKVIPDFTGMPPQHVAIWRFTLATPPAWLILGLNNRSRNLMPDHPWLFLGLGLIFSIASFSAIFALQRLTSSIYVILIYIYPSLIVIYALLTGGRVPRLYWLGLPITLLGLFLTSFDFGSALAIDPIGMAITLVNALALVAYMVLSEKAFTNMAYPLLGTTGVMSGAMLVGLLLIPILGISAPETLRGWILLVSLSLFGTLMPMIAMNISLGLLGAARGSVIITLQPVLTVVMAMVFLNESLSFQQWIGGGLVILAIVLLQRSPDRLRKPGQEKPWRLHTEKDLTNEKVN
jgi:drug/metabolite transporter (DMT)-like permease